MSSTSDASLAYLLCSFSNVEVSFLANLILGPGWVPFLGSPLSCLPEATHRGHSMGCCCAWMQQ